MTGPGNTALVLVAATGRDATTFLHGQFCGDLLALPDRGSLLTAWCSARGRVITTLVASRSGPGWYLLLPGNLAPRVLQRLHLFVLRAEVTLAPEPADMLTRLQREDLMPTAAGLLDADQGRPWVDVATSEQFLPQELDLERWGGLSYEKGCYPGQEIVARLHYRGATKRGPRRVLAPAAAGDLAVPGAALMNAGGTPAGTVLYAGAAGGDTLPLVAVVDHATPDPGVLYLGSPPFPVDVRGSFA